MHNGRITSLLLYPIKYLNEFFVPYGSSLKTDILSKSMSSILIIFFYAKVIFFIFLFPKNSCSFHTFLYWIKKSKNLL